MRAVQQKLPYAVTDPDILKTGGAQCRQLWLAAEDNIRFQMV